MENINHPHHRGHFKIPANPKCGFCHSAAVRWLYRTSPFFVVDVRHVFAFCTDWTTCDECHALIERRDTKAMVKRIAIRDRIDLKARPPAEPFNTAVFEGFLESMHGLPQPFRPEASHGNN